MSTPTPLRLPHSQENISAAADALDAALEHEVARIPRGTEPANLLSGGIDSTLLQSYLGQTRTVSSAVDSPEFEFEKTYALSASRLLGTRHDIRSIDESDYLGRLEDSIDALGAPPHHLQTVLLDAAFGADPPTYVTAQFADALFGLDAARRATAAWPWRKLFSAFDAPGLLHRRVRNAWTSRRETVIRLAVPARDSASFALGFAVYSDLPLVADLFGSDMVEERLASRRDYVEERLALHVDGRTGPGPQLELGHWIDFFCDNTVSLWRQLAHSRGKSLYAPFSMSAVVQASGALFSPDRYVRRGRTKPVLRELLRRRVPAYPVDQPKGGSGLPFSRYYTTGPLAGALRSHERPDFIPSGLWERLVVEPGWTSWNALTFVIWRDRVLHNPRLAVMPETRQLEIPV